MIPMVALEYACVSEGVHPRVLKCSFIPPGTATRPIECIFTIFRSISLAIISLLARASARPVIGVDEVHTEEEEWQ